MPRLGKRLLGYDIAPYTQENVDLAVQHGFDWGAELKKEVDELVKQAVIEAAKELNNEE